MRVLRNGRLGRGFTLLEVLIGVLVLALALLGLAAVFPVVVRTQRIARDTVLGTAMLESAETMLRNHELLRDANKGIKELTRQIGLAPQPVRTMWEATLDPSATRRFIYTDGGALRFVQNGPTLLPSDRLNLMFNSGGATDPTLVWDVAMCLAEEMDYPSQPVGGILNGNTEQVPTPPGVRMAIFVRRLDPQIRVRSGFTLLQSIENGSAVAIGSTEKQFGEATLNGTGFYGVPMYVTVNRVLQSRRNGPWDILELQFANNARLPAARAVGQNGQLLVDNRGGVHTVVRNVRDAAGNPIANQVLLEKGLSSRTEQLANDASHPVQVVFTAQVPAAVRVITYQP